MSAASRTHASGRPSINVGTQRRPRMKNGGNQTQPAIKVGPWPDIHERSIEDSIPTHPKRANPNYEHPSIPTEKNYVLRPMDESIADRTGRSLRDEDARDRNHSHSRDIPTGKPSNDRVEPGNQAQPAKVARALFDEKQSTPNGRRTDGTRPLDTLSLISPDSPQESHHKRSGDPREKESKNTQADEIYDHPTSIYSNPGKSARGPPTNNKSIASTPGPGRSSAPQQKNYLLRLTSAETSSPAKGKHTGDSLLSTNVGPTTKPSDQDLSHYSVPSPSPQRDIDNKEPTSGSSRIVGSVINSSRIYVNPTELSPDDDPYTFERLENDDDSSVKETQSFVAQPFNRNDTGDSQDHSAWV